ncbi:DUF4249 family protein [Mucilaginibacter xinganensis]|uniref:DUF4249 domain-containing protein n=1 Tax=Mucilaginibacter xinganensis TaxID=1234841 RepID=A0A223P162_9SPHI|nr:DUF4249 family protein [Mucilaginibacter xinganensis]ASU35855.1 hypothetical protein MuYL_3970 [Mucilaginibacter xinganensis]
MEIKRYKLKAMLLGSLLAVTLYACKKENVTTASVNLPVVEAYLMAGKPITIKVYQQKDISDTAKYGAGIKGLQLSIADGSKTVVLTETKAGTYVYADSTFLTAGKTYSLKFSYLTYAVSATTVMPAKPQNFATRVSTITIDGLTGRNSATDTLNRFTWTNPDSLNHVLLFNNLDGIDFPTGSFGNRSANFIMNTERAAAFEVTQRPFSYYGHYDVVLLRVNKEYIDLLTSNSANSTSQSLASQPTNVLNGFGIFTAMQADTLKFNVF